MYQPSVLVLLALLGLAAPAEAHREASERQVLTRPARQRVNLGLDLGDLPFDRL